MKAYDGFIAMCLVASAIALLIVMALFVGLLVYFIARDLLRNKR